MIMREFCFKKMQSKQLVTLNKIKYQLVFMMPSNKKDKMLTRKLPGAFAASNPYLCPPLLRLITNAMELGWELLLHAIYCQNLRQSLAFLVWLAH